MAAFREREHVELKSAAEINALKISGQLTAGLLEFLCNQVQEGMTTLELDRLAARWMKDNQVRPAFLNYRGYPAHICVSINDEVVHGIPGPRKICSGDVVSIDVGAFRDGWCGDTARTVAIGAIDPVTQKLLDASRESLEASMAAAVVGNRLGDVSYAMQKVVEDAGFNVVRGYGGHGIGRAMHEDPHVPCVGTKGTGLRLKPGMVLALEVMANVGSHHIDHKPDGWTVVTRDGKPSAHFEHMVAITENGTEVLTRPPGMTNSDLGKNG